MASNCSECYWGYENQCCVIRATDGCMECPHLNPDTLECRCTEIEQDEEHECPEFRDLRYYGKGESLI